ncbi:MAG: hypothetical protein AAFP97_05580 [Pseudomonadota bacterium]
MTENDLNRLLADYMAPTADEGFSDTLMQAVRAESTLIDLSDYVTPTSKPWRSWVIALTLGLVSGLIWTWLGLSLPDIPTLDHEINLLQNSVALYLMAAFCMAGSLLYIGLDSA